MKSFTIISTTDKEGNENISINNVGFDTMWLIGMLNVVRDDLIINQLNKMGASPNQLPIEAINQSNEL